MHGQGASSHLSTLCLTQRVHIKVQQLLATFLEAWRRLPNPFCYLRPQKIGYNWLQSTTIRHSLVFCASREAQPCLNVCFACLLGAHGSHLNEDTVPAFNLSHIYTLDCSPALECKKQLELPMSCTVMVDLHILVHCAFTKGDQLCLRSFLQHIWRPRVAFCTFFCISLNPKSAKPGHFIVKNLFFCLRQAIPRAPPPL